VPPDCDFEPTCFNEFWSRNRHILERIGFVDEPEATICRTKPLAPTDLRCGFQFPARLLRGGLVRAVCDVVNVSSRVHLWSLETAPQRQDQ
jgi:hypothetical protein